MKKTLLIPTLFLSLGLLVGCNGNNDNGGGSASDVPTIKESENQFKSYTGQQFLDKGFQWWCDKTYAEGNGILYTFTGDYTEAYARQLYPTYFDCYMFKDGSVFGTYRANFVDSENDPNGRMYYLDGDGHAANEVWFGYWYNLSDAGESCLNIQWKGYGDFYSGHLCNYDMRTDIVDVEGSLQGAISLTINGNSRTCFIRGNRFVNYKKDTFTVTELPKARKTLNGCDPVFNPGLQASCECVDGTKVKFASYLLDWSFDENGNVIAEYPLMGLKSVGAVKVTVTPTVYNTKIKYDGALVECKITRTNTETIKIEVGGKTGVFNYEEIYTRTVLDIQDKVSGDLDATKIGTKYFYIGYAHTYETVDASGATSLAQEFVSDPSGTSLIPEVNHYKCVESTTSLNPESKLAKNGGYNGVASDMDKIHIEGTKGPTGVHSDGCELIRFIDFNHTDGNGNNLEIVAYRTLVSTNGQFIDYNGLCTYNEDTHVLSFNNVHKWGNNISFFSMNFGGFVYSTDFSAAVLNDANNTFTVAAPNSSF